MKTKLLIVLSALTLVCLVGIQGFLIYNSYELKQKTITIDARNAIAKVYNTPQVDSISWLYRNEFLKGLEGFEQGSISKDSLLTLLKEKSAEINPGFLDFYQKGLKEFGDDMDVQFKKIVTSIQVIDSLGTIETLFPETGNDTIVLLGENFNQSEGLLINNSTWQKDHDIVLPNGIETINLNFKSSIFMNITNWNGLIIRELSVLLLLSTILFLFVVGLLYYSIQNLLKQKRLAEVKTDFINNITHELKTPLSTLSLATKTLTSDYSKDKAEIKTEAVEIIERQNTRLQKLIDEVLKSSLGYQEIQLNKDNFNVAVFLNNLLDDYELTTQDTISIERTIESTGVLMNGDTFYMGTAIINLLNNAIKYGGTEMEVIYFVDKNSNNHLIKVVDNGIGIAPKYHKYIFEKFYRVSEKDTHNYKGLGLGLYYTSQIIKTHDGSITVASNSKEGTVFTILIPISS